MQKKNYYLESVLDLNASNVWGTEAQELLELWQKDIKEEGFSSSEEKVLNVIRLAFDVYHFDPKDDREVMRYSDGNYVILPCVDKRKGAVAIRKKEIRRITDLSYENIKHITASDLLKLIEGNFGGGWDSISLTIKDIIESAFDISTTTLPASRIHAAGGTLERKVADGYEALEIAKGTWVEAIFAKKREPVEKLRFVPEPEYDEDGNRRIVDEDTETDSESEEEGDTAGDDTFYGSYTPEADIKDVEEELDIDFGDVEFETLNGYLTSFLGHVPSKKDVDVVIKANGYMFTILSIGNKTIGKVRAEKLAEEKNPADKNNS